VLAGEKRGGGKDRGTERGIVAEEHATLRAQQKKKAKKNYRDTERGVVAEEHAALRAQQKKKIPRHGGRRCR
jgi:hypothetical protein